MTNQHHIVPSPEQVDQWLDDAMQLNSTPKYYIARQAALWGADQELEACCELLVRDWTDIETADKLRAARRPKPPSLKEKALAVLMALEFDEPGYKGTYNTIRRALEQLDG